MVKMTSPSPVNAECEIAASLLKRAVELELKKRYTESIICYQEGIQILLNVVRNMVDDSSKGKYRVKIQEYLSRAETLKGLVEKEKSLGNYRERFTIENDSYGHSYQAVFGRFLDHSVVKIEIDDPYIRLFHQCQNFLRFCELAVTSCKRLKEISLTTTSSDDNRSQEEWLTLIRQELSTRFSVTLSVRYSSTLHDREIRYCSHRRLSNGWIIKIGRGLDYFKVTEHKFSLGLHDFNLRKCYETTVDIFHKKNVQQLPTC